MKKGYSTQIQCLLPGMLLYLHAHYASGKIKRERE